MNGFTYNGIHSEALNCWHIPDATDNWFASPDFEVMDQEVIGRSGGYWYGNRVKSRTFTLKMFFEDITQTGREKIRAWLDQKTSGELIFDDRPFVYYNVRPTKTVTGKIYTTRHEGYSNDTYSGTFTVTFTAYEPFGFLKYKYFTDYDNDGAGLYCGMLEQGEMPTAPTAASRSFQMYNCGTEPCDTKITIAGTAANGLTITNKTNGTKCALSSLPSTGKLEIESDIGAIHTVSGNNRALDFQYHDEGFLRLAPAGVLIDGVIVNTTAGSTSAVLINCEENSGLTGKHIRIDGAWVKISAAMGNNITQETAASNTESKQTKITQMNEIEITGDNVTLTELTIDYFPKIV